MELYVLIKITLKRFFLIMKKKRNYSQPSICGFFICGFNSPKIENIWEKMCCCHVLHSRPTVVVSVLNLYRHFSLSLFPKQ
jgi:hypothetical protein